MIGIYLRPDKTYVVKAKLEKYQKSKRLEISPLGELAAYLDAVILSDVNFLAELFKEIKMMTSTFSEEFYIVLPDYVFETDCCNELELNEKLSDLAARMETDIKNIYTAYPIKFKTSARTLDTVCVIKKSIVDTLAEAAKEEDISLVSIEPAGFSLLRCLQNWKKEQIFIDITKKNQNTHFTTYTPVAGMFSLTVDTIDGYFNDNDAAKAALAQNDNLAKDTFDVVNIDVPIQFLEQPTEEICKLPVINKRLAEVSELSACVTFKDNISSSEKYALRPLIGSLMQSIPEKYFALYDTGLKYLNVKSANVLPENVQRQSKFMRFQKLANKYSKIFISIFLLLIAVQGVGIFYYSFEKIPEVLKNDYERATNEIEAVKKELNLIAVANKEEQHPYEALQVLISDMPQGIGFASIDIGEKQEGNEKDTKKESVWIRFTAKSADPMVLRDYTTRLSEETLFKNINIQQISTSGNNGMKSAIVQIGKGKVD